MKGGEVHKPMVTQTQKAREVLRRSPAVQRVRIPTWDTLVIISKATGEEFEVSGPCEVLLVDDRMVIQGW